MRTQPIPRPELNDVDAVGGRRSRRRIPVEALVTLNADTQAVEAMVLDVSETGLRISLQNPPPPGPITVKLVGLPILAGEVRWRDALNMGVLLGRPIAGDYLAVWVKVHGDRH
jgi:hypothetical protein